MFKVYPLPPGIRWDELDNRPVFPEGFFDEFPEPGVVASLLQDLQAVFAAGIRMKAHIFRLSDPEDGLDDDLLEEYCRDLARKDITHDGGSPSRVNRYNKLTLFDRKASEPYIFFPITGVKAPLADEEEQIWSNKPRPTFEALLKEIKEVGGVRVKFGVLDYPPEAKARIARLKASNINHIEFTPLPSPTDDELIRALRRDAEINLREMGISLEDLEMLRATFYEDLEESGGILISGSPKYPKPQRLVEAMRKLRERSGKEPEMFESGFAEVSPEDLAKLIELSKSANNPDNPLDPIALFLTAERFDRLWKLKLPRVLRQIVEELEKGLKDRVNDPDSFSLIVPRFKNAKGGMVFVFNPSDKNDGDKDSEAKQYVREHVYDHLLYDRGIVPHEHNGWIKALLIDHGLIYSSIPDNVHANISVREYESILRRVADMTNTLIEKDDDPHHDGTQVGEAIPYHLGEEIPPVENGWKRFNKPFPKWLEDAVKEYDKSPGTVIAVDVRYDNVDLDDPRCPNCGNIYCSNWEDIRSSLRANLEGNGEQPRIKHERTLLQTLGRALLLTLILIFLRLVTNFLSTVSQLLALLWRFVLKPVLTVVSFVNFPAWYAMSLITNYPTTWGGAFLATFYGWGVWTISHYLYGLLIRHRVPPAYDIPSREVIMAGIRTRLTIRLKMFDLEIWWTGLKEEVHDIWMAVTDDDSMQNTFTNPRAWNRVARTAARLRRFSQNLRKRK